MHVFLAEGTKLLPGAVKKGPFARWHPALFLSFGAVRPSADGARYRSDGLETGDVQIGLDWTRASPQLARAAMLGTPLTVAVCSGSDDIIYTMLAHNAAVASYSIQPAANPSAEPTVNCTFVAEEWEQTVRAAPPPICLLLGLTKHCSQ